MESDTPRKGDSIDTGTTDSVDSGESAADTAVDSDSPADTADSGAGVDSCGTVLDTDLEEIPPRKCDPTLPWVDVSAGAFLTCGVKADGCGECWGDDANTQEYQIPGVSFLTIQLSSFVDSEDDISPHICGLTDVGEIRCWGGTNRHHENEAPVGAFVSLATGGTTAAAVRDDGALVQWGAHAGCSEGGYDAVVGSNTAYAALRSDASMELFGAIDQTTLVAGLWATLAHGYYNVCGLLVEPGGVLACVWSDDGSASTDDFSGDPTGPFLDVCVSPFGDVCVLDPEGVPTCYGELMGTPAGPFVDLSCGFYHSCGLTGDGDIECWGDDFGGETTPPS